MRLCRSFATKFSSSSSSSQLLGPPTSLLPEASALSVVDSLLLTPQHSHSSARQQSTPDTPPSLQMAHQSSLMSPVKGRAFCSSSGGGNSGNSTPAVPCCSPVKRAPLLLSRSPAAAHAAPHKRCLSAVAQQCLNSSSSAGAAGAAGDNSILSRQQHGSFVGPVHPPPAPPAPAAAAAAAADRHDPACQAAKRHEVIKGSSSSRISSTSPAAAPKPCQPVTPAIIQPEPLASGLQGAAQQQQEVEEAVAIVLPLHTSKNNSSAGFSSPLLNTADAAAASSPRGVVDDDADGGGGGAGGSGCCSPAMLPAPTAILDSPPQLTASAAAQQLAATVSRQQRQQQQHQHHSNKPKMSGQQVALIYDIPVDISFLDQYADLQPQLGSGRLDVIMGPMFAGKTTALLQRVQELVGSKPALLGVKSVKDKRYGNHWILSHDGKCMRGVKAASLAEFKAHLGPRWHKLQVIAVDEAQFFPDLVEFCQEAVDHDGKHMIVAGLSGDFKRRRFGQVLDLLPLADSITQLKSTCSVCGGEHGPALFSLRRLQQGPQEMVGGDEVYQATCRRCYLEHGGDSD